MKKLVLLAALCCFVASTRAQTAATGKPPPMPANGADPDNDRKVSPAYDKLFTSVTNPPYFPGGMDSLHRYLSKHIVYPPALLNAHTGGTVVVSFVVEKDGNLSLLQAQRSPAEAMSVEVLRVFAGIHFINGNQNGHAVRVMYTIPVRFDPDMPEMF